MKKCDEDFFEFENQNSLIYQMRLSLALKQRKILIYDDIEKQSVTEVLYYLYKLKEMDSFLGEKSTIEILINSNGGYCDDGLTLVSLIESMKLEGYEIITTNIGKAYSMAFILSIVGSKRYSYKYATYMVHDISASTFGKLEGMEQDIENIKKTREVLYDIIVNNTGLTREELIEWHEKHLDKYFDANAAKELNIADSIV